jgi:hypothetical protein
MGGGLPRASKGARWKAKHKRLDLHLIPFDDGGTGF